MQMHISHKAGKEGKNHVGKASPKKRDERMHGWDGVIKNPTLRHTSMYIHKRMEKEEKSYEEKVPPKKEKKETR